MASNELRARLVGWTNPYYEKHGAWRWTSQSGVVVGRCPDYDTSRDACAELLEYVQERGRIEVFIHHVSNKSSYQNFAREIEHMWNGLTATPTQICAAFDATFAKELAELESKHGK